METIVATIPGYRVFDYLLVMNLPGELSERVSKTREEFADKFKTENARWGKAQLALVNFSQYEMMEERIVHRLRTIAMGFPPFKTELKNFGSFPSHTIYIAVTSKIPVQHLVKEIRSGTQKLMKLDDEHKPHFIMEPHITIGRKLLPWQYEKGWLEYSHKHFTGRFIADNMTLLKRPAGEMRYQVVERFAFQNLPVVTKQGELFS